MSALVVVASEKTTRFRLSSPLIGHDSRPTLRRQSGKQLLKAERYRIWRKGCLVGGASVCFAAWLPDRAIELVASRWHKQTGNWRTMDGQHDHATAASSTAAAGADAPFCSGSGMIMYMDGM